MFEFNNLTDFEKLLFAKSYIKELKVNIQKLEMEKGIMKSEIDELKYRIKQEKPEVNKLIKYKKQMKDTRVKSKEWQRKYERVNSELIMLKNSSV